MSKEIFPGLLRQLWVELLTPAHCQSGFRASGIFPLSRDAVLSKLTQSEVFRCTETQSPQRRLEHISCDACGHMRAIPYIRTHLKGYFRGVLEIKTQPARVRSHTRVRIEGEVITSNEFIQLLQREKQGKGKRNTCTQNETVPQHNDSEVESTDYTYLLCCCVALLASFFQHHLVIMYKYIHVYLMDCGK